MTKKPSFPFQPHLHIIDITSTPQTNSFKKTIGLFGVLDAWDNLLFQLIHIGDSYYGELQRFCGFHQNVTVNRKGELFNLPFLIFYWQCSYEREKLLSFWAQEIVWDCLNFWVVLYGCETWSLTLREERRLRVFENRVLRRIWEYLGLKGTR
jgi:hypothetical protein